MPKPSVFPGIDITGSLKEWKSRIRNVMNPKRLPLGDFLRDREYVGVEIFDSDFFVSNDEFLLWYQHPVHEFKHKLFRVERESLVRFLRERVVPDRHEGLDMTITTPRLREFLVCNHDGDMYYVLPEQ